MCFVLLLLKDKFFLRKEFFMAKMCGIFETLSARQDKLISQMDLWEEGWIWTGESLNKDMTEKQ